MSRPVLGALMVFTLCEVFAALGGISDNILWAPDTPVRAAALVVTLSPVLVLAAHLSARRRRRHESRDETRHG